MFVRSIFRKPFYGMVTPNYKSSPFTKNFCTSQAVSNLNGCSICQKKDYLSLVWLGVSICAATVFCFYYYKAEPERSNILLEKSVYTLVRAGHISQAIEVSSKLGDLYRRSNALKSICEELINKGDLSQAKQLLASFPSFDHPCLQAYYENMLLMKISSAYLEIGEKEMALETLGKAKKSSDSILTRQSVPLINNFIDLGCFDYAKQLTNSIIAREKNQEDMKGTTEALEAIALAFLDAGEQNEAMRLKFIASRTRELFDLRESY